MIFTEFDIIYEIFIHISTMHLLGRCPPFIDIFCNIRLSNTACTIYINKDLKSHVTLQNRGALYWLTLIRFSNKLIISALK